MTGKGSRRNLTEQSAEDFKPIVFRPNNSWLNRTTNWIRRFLDLQAGSAWRDLSRELTDCNGRLVDIGCGAQIYRPLVPPDVEYCGIDTADAKERFGYLIPDTVYFVDDDWGIEDSGFDTALCTEVLEHIPEPDVFLARIFRCLRPGGRLLLTVPFAARWHFIPYDYWRFTPSSLRRLLEDAGFTEPCVYARGNPLTVACYKVMALILILLVDSDENRGKTLRRIAGFVLLPIFGTLAVIANISLFADWGDDCLGYTVTARRPNLAI